MFPAEGKPGEGFPAPRPARPPCPAPTWYLRSDTGAGSRRARLTGACRRRGGQRLRCGSTCEGRACGAGTHILRAWEWRSVLGTGDTAASQAAPAQLPGLQAGGEAHAANTELSMVLCALKAITWLRDRKGLKVAQPGRVGDPVWGSDTLAKAWQGAEGRAREGQAGSGHSTCKGPETRGAWPD